jgi:hypothetical protein
MEFFVLTALFLGCIFFAVRPIFRQGERPLACLYLLCLTLALTAGLLACAHVKLPNPMTPCLALGKHFNLIK